MADFRGWFWIDANFKIGLRLARLFLYLLYLVDEKDLRNIVALKQIGAAFFGALKRLLVAPLIYFFWITAEQDGGH